MQIVQKHKQQNLNSSLLPCCPLSFSLPLPHRCPRRNHCHSFVDTLPATFLGIFSYNIIFFLFFYTYMWTYWSTTFFFSLHHSPCRSFPIGLGAQREGLQWEYRHTDESSAQVMGLNKNPGSVYNVWNDSRYKKKTENI